MIVCQREWDNPAARVNAILTVLRGLLVGLKDKEDGVIVCFYVVAGIFFTHGESAAAGGS